MDNYKNSFVFYNLWEELHNENFNSVESHRIKIDEAGYKGKASLPISFHSMPNNVEK